MPTSAEFFPDGDRPSPEDVVIALMGITGSGKSSFISLCSDSKPEIGHELESCTRHVAAFPFVFDGPPQKRIFLVDTPGFNDSSRSDAEVLRETSAWLTRSYKENIRLSGIIYLHRINEPRMQGSAKSNILLFRKLCGDDALQNVVLATTMWDVIEAELGAKREHDLMHKKEYWGYMLSKGSKVYRHNNTRRSAMNIIRHFVREDTKVTLEIQEDMVENHKSLDNTLAGKSVHIMLAEERAAFEQKLREVEAELRGALEKKDTNFIEVLKDLREEHRKNLEETRKAQDSLRVTLERLHEQRYSQLEEQLAAQAEAYQNLLASTQNSSPPLSNAISNANQQVPSLMIRRFEGKNNRTLQLALTLKGHQKDVVSVCFSPDGRLLASGSRDGTVKLWDPSTGRLARTLKGYLGDITGKRVRSVSFSPDGRRLASGSRDGTVRLWDPSTARRVRSLEGHKKDVMSISFSPDGRLLASGSRDTTVKLWDLITGRLARSLEGHQKDVLSVSFSPNGRLLASGSDDGTVKLWHPSTGQLARTVEGYQKAITSVSFSPDGQLLACGSHDGTIKLWAPSTGQLVRTLEAHQMAVASVSFSPNGQRLACGSHDGTITLWDPSTGRLAQTVEAHQKAVMSISFSPDGEVLASGSSGWAVKLWNWS